MQLPGIHKTLTLILQATLVVGVILFCFQGRWMTAVVTSSIIVVTLLPLILGRRFDVQIPPEYEVLTVVFVYASLFLGEVHGCYIRYWWWSAKRDTEHTPPTK